MVGLREGRLRVWVVGNYYWQMERGYRRLPVRLVSRAVRKLHLAPTALPMQPLATQFVPVASDELASALARLGYEAFGHLSKRAKAYNSAYLVVGTLVHADLEVRIVEVLPWILSTFHDLDWLWLIAQGRLLTFQNRLGYLVVLARQLGNSTADVNFKNAVVHL